MNTLLIDNTHDRDCWGSADISRFLTSDQKSTLHVRRAPHDDLPDDIQRYDRVVLSGSRTSCLIEDPWVKNLDRFVENFLRLERPFLGICYGHQALCRVLGGKTSLRRGNSPEFGWINVRQLKRNKLMEGLPENFHTYASHYEEAHSLPSEMVKIAESERCSIQAVQWKNLPIYGIQFHPEKLEAEGNLSLEKDVKAGKKEGVIGYGKSQKLYSRAVGESIFRNFLEMR